MKMDYRPPFVMRGGSSDGTRSYHGKNGQYFFIRTEKHPWRLRSTVNKSPYWGLRTGTALWTKDGWRRFSNCWWHRPWQLKNAALHKISYIMWDRRSPFQFFPGKYQDDR